MPRLLLLTIFLMMLSCSVFANKHELVKAGVYDEEGNCIEPAIYVVYPHKFTMRDYGNRPDLAGQGMPKKKKKSAWKTFIEDNPKKYCDEEDVKRERRECEAWHKNKNERVEWCERLLKENWGEDALQWAKWAVLIKYETRMVVQFAGMMGGPAGAVGATASEFAWTFTEPSDDDAPRVFYEQSQELAESVYDETLAIRTAELGRKGQGGGLDVTIKNYGPGRAGNFHNAKIDAIHKEAVATKSANTGMKNLGKALPYVSMGSLNVEYGIDLAKLEDLEKQHGVAYRKCVEAINELKATKCPICGIQ